LAKYELLGPGIAGRVTAGAQKRYFNPPNFHGNGGGKYRCQGAMMWRMRDSEALAFIAIVALAG
jgi:hypothetical protein